MKFGLARKVYAYNFDLDKGCVVIARPAAWSKATKFIKDQHYEGDDQAPIWGWYALKSAGKLEELGLPSELTLETLDEMAEYASFELERITDADLPLSLVGQGM